MAGSYQHVVEHDEDGRLSAPEDINSMLECRSGDVVECVEEMYGMIWFLAQGDATSVEQARQNYLEGLEMSPGVSEGHLSLSPEYNPRLRARIEAQRRAERPASG